MKKAMSQAMWLIIAIIVALVVALVVITVVNKGTTNAGDNGDSLMSIFGETAKTQSCQTACDTCKQVGGGTCGELPKTCKDIDFKCV